MPRKRKSEPESYNNAFPLRLRKLMKENGTTQEDLAKVLGLSARQSIGAYADGRASPNLQNLVKISDFFNVSADWLLGKTDSTDCKDFTIPYEIKDVFMIRLNLLYIYSQCKSVVAFADKAGITRQAMTSYLDGYCLPDYVRLMSICMAFSVSADWLMGIESQKKGEEVVNNNWISVKDQLPDMGAVCLVYADGRCFVAKHIANGRWIKPGLSTDPTHWMPIPEPPKEGMTE